MERDQLFDILKSRFNDNELRELCFTLKIDYESLGGDNKTAKARELLLLCERTDRVAELEREVVRLRPPTTQPTPIADTPAPQPTHLQLNQGDFDQLVGILSQQPDFRTVQGRVDLMTEMLAGSPRKADVLNTLNLDGNPRGVAVRVIDRLQTFGQDQAGREVLGLLINKLLSFVGAGANADFLRGLFQRYPLNVPPTNTRGITDGWRGTETDGKVQEKIIGENTLRDVRMLQLLLDASRAVVRISGPLGLGSGFMVASDLVMTNNHVIASAEDAAKCAFTFNFQLGADGRESKTFGAVALPGGLFHTSPESQLDYTVLQLRDAPVADSPFGFAPLLPKPARAQKEQRVSIIQHPGGHYKKVSMQNNFVAFADTHVLQYTTSTEPGSSGSPVFAEQEDGSFAVIAIHHAGGMLREPGSPQTYLRNEGICMIAVLDDLKQNAPQIYTRLGL